MILPVLLPMRNGGNELRPQQPRARREQHTLLLSRLLIRLHPRGPSPAEILLHDPAYRHLLRVLNPLLLLLLELLLQKPLLLRLLSAPLNHRLAGLLELEKRPVELRLHLRALLDLLLILLSNRHRLLRGLRRPHNVAPVLVRPNELRS